MPPKQMTRLEKFQKAKQELITKYGADSFSDHDIQIRRLDTGAFLLNAALGGGWPMGRIAELYGIQSSGKSTIATTTCRNAIQEELPVLYLDHEQVFDPHYARSLGLDIDSPYFELAQPGTLEEGLSLAKGFLNDEAVGLVVLDSVAGAIPKAYTQGEVDKEPRIGEKARILSNELPQLAKLCADSEALFLLINQTRDNLSPMARGGKSTPGGQAIKFATSCRVELAIIKNDKGSVTNTLTGKAEQGNVRSLVRAQVRKNKTARPYMEGYYFLRHGRGLSEEDAVLEFLAARGCIHKGGGGFFTIDPIGGYDEVKLRGLDTMIQHLHDDSAYFGLLRNAANELASREFATAPIATETPSDGEPDYEGLE